MTKGEIGDLREKCYELLNCARFNEARQLLESALSNCSVESVKNNIFPEMEIYGLMTDLGCESHNESDLEKAALFFEQNKIQITKYVHVASYYYNLGNAKQGIAQLFQRGNPGIPSLQIIKEKFQDPIQIYWLAYKNSILKGGVVYKQILVNLANSLVRVGRIVEGLQFLDIVLKEDSEFPEALLSRADHLKYWTEVTNCGLTAALFCQIYRNYDDGIKSNRLAIDAINMAKDRRGYALEALKTFDFQISDIEKEVRETEKEFQNHSEFRKFCIRNFLTLNEHGIYCNCVATEKDDIQVGVPNGSFTGDTVPKLELLLNGLKSEFAYSRWTYYQFLLSDDEENSDVKYTELLDGELISHKIEMLRTSFRIAYGILDKIALGICKLYDMDTNRIHFETFWENQKIKPKILSIKNIHLNALYSIACDLNTSTGELKHFKNWRNKLEHNLLVIKSQEEINFDVFKIFADKDFVAVADIEDFQKKTLHLLQLTRAAIFSFVYCVRLETIQDLPDEKLIVKMGYQMKFK